MSAENAWRRWASIFVGVGLTFVALVALISRGNSAVLVRVKAESVSIELDSGAARMWYVRRATVAIDDGDGAPFTGQLEPTPGAKVRAERLGKGDLYVLIEARSAESAGRLIDSAEQLTRTARSTIELRIPAAAVEGHLLPYSGRAVVGEIVGPQTRFGAPILLSGSIQIIGRTVIEGQPYVAAEAEPQAGDQIEIAARAGGVAPSHGFLRVDAEEGMFVASDASGLGVRTRRFGVEDAFVVRRSPFSAFKDDHWILLLAFLIPLLAPASIDWISRYVAAGR